MSPTRALLRINRYSGQDSRPLCLPFYISSSLACHHLPTSTVRRNWNHEIKHDGYRLMARRDSVGIRLITRRGNDWSERYPSVVETVNHLKMRACLIDGEVVCV